MVKKTVKFVRKNERSTTYRIANVETLTGRLIDRLPWGKDLTGLIFKLEADTGNEYETLRKNIPGKYCAILSYSAPADKLHVPVGELVKSAVKLVKIKSQAELKAIFIETYSKLFLARWSGRIGYEAFLGVGRYIQNRLPESAGFCVKIKGKMVGGLITAVIPKNADGKAVDRIGWIWVDPQLTATERRTVHYRFYERLRSSKTGRTQCFIDSFNQRSQAFFRKLGLVPEEVIITRK